jgi:hypothetical protein
LHPQTACLDLHGEAAGVGESFPLAAAVAARQEATVRWLLDNKV